MSTVVPPAREPTRHLAEILRIVDGGLHADRGKVAAYAEQLATKLEHDGQVNPARRIRRLLEGASQNLTPALVSSPTRSVPVDSDSRLRLADEVVPRREECDVILGRASEATVRHFVDCVKASDRLLAHGIGVAPSLIAYGPPGCGKTMLGYRIAAELGLPILVARMDSLISSYLGSTSKNIRNLFDHAKARPCVLLLDEFDAIAKLRDDVHELGELKRVVVSLLQNIDATQNQTVLVAATNHEHLLDPAVWRRFAFRIQVGLPDLGARRLMFSRYLGPFSSDAIVDDSASLAEGLSGADIRTVCEDAVREAVLTGKPAIAATALLRGVLNYRGKTGDELELPNVLRVLRSLAPDRFTYRRLSELFGVSLGSLSRLFAKADDNGK